MSDEMHTCPACGIEYADDVLMKLRAENAALHKTLEELRRVLGPSAPDCLGCAIEIAEALRIIDAAKEQR